MAQATNAEYGPSDAASGRSRDGELDVVQLLARRRDGDAERRARREEPRQCQMRRSMSPAGSSSMQ